MVHYNGHKTDSQSALWHNRRGHGALIAGLHIAVLLACTLLFASAVVPGPVRGATGCDLSITGPVSLTESTVFARENNTITINGITNRGSVACPATDLELQSDDGFSGRTPVPALNAGVTYTASINDTTIRPLAGTLISYNATVDPDNTVVESNETNNTITASYTVVYNGYKGKMYWAGKSNITTSRSWDLHGGLLYSSGDSEYTSGISGRPSGNPPQGKTWLSYPVNWSAADLPIPTDAIVREVRLYVPYTWDKEGQAPSHTHIKFNGVMVNYEDWYHDVSNFGTYKDYTYGLLTYNVTSQFVKNAKNTAVFSRDTSGTLISPYGFTLAVIYENATAPRRQIFLNEEFDLLGADDTNFATTPEEATAYVPFTGQTLVPADLVRADLISFVPSGNGPEGNLLFNGQTISTNVWQYDSSGTEVAISSKNVTDYLRADRNEAAIRSTTTSKATMVAGHQFLIIEYNTLPVVPVVAFTANTTAGSVPLVVQFTDKSSAAPTAWAWDFDNDGTVDSTLRNPVYTYVTSGIFTVNLTATNAVGSNSTARTGYITATPGTAPVAAFTADRIYGAVPLTVQFTDTSTGTPTSWAWDFDNNGTVDSTIENPVHTFVSPGTYTINLTAMNALGSNSTVKTGYITAVPSTAPVAAFTANRTSGTVPLSIQFTDLSTGTVTSWAWDFNNDGTTDSAAKNPVHTYTPEGSYTVKLTVTNVTESSSTMKIHYITVSADSSGSTGSGGDSGSSTVSGSSVKGISDPKAEKMKGAVYDYSFTKQDIVAGSFRTTLVSKKGRVSVTPLNADTDTMPEAKSSWSAEIVSDPDGGGKITTGIIRTIPETVLASYRSVLAPQGLEISGVAYAMYISKDNRIPATRDALITMTAPQKWVTENGGIGQVKILRIADDGTPELLSTTFSGYDHDSGYLTFRADSPEGLCSFTLIAVRPGTGGSDMLSSAQSLISSFVVPAGESGPSAPVTPSGAGNFPLGIIAGIAVIIGGVAVAGYAWKRRREYV